MILTACRDEGVERVHVTRFASVETWFTEDEGGSGLVLHVAPGHLAFPQDFERNKAAVRAAVLSEVADRLGVPEEAVLSQPFKRLKAIADPDLPEHYRYARRSKNRAYPLR